MIVPSRVKPISTCWTCARPWVIATMFSERVSVHFTGRPSSCAAFTATAYSAYMPVLAPKPPPTAGAITRTCSGVEAGDRARSRRLHAVRGLRRDVAERDRRRRG